MHIKQTIINYVFLVVLFLSGFFIGYLYHDMQPLSAHPAQGLGVP